MVSLPGVTVCYVMSELSEPADLVSEPDPQAADSVSAAMDANAAAARINFLPENTIFLYPCLHTACKAQFFLSIMNVRHYRLLMFLKRRTRYRIM